MFCVSCLAGNGHSIGM